jgi:hypothetical protein
MEKPAVPIPPAAPAADLPPECLAYKALADKLATCERLGKQRDLLKGEFDKSWKAWGELPAEQRADVAARCTHAANTLRSAVAAACGW